MKPSPALMTGGTGDLNPREPFTTYLEARASTQVFRHVPPTGVKFILLHKHTPSRGGLEVGRPLSKTDPAWELSSS